MWSWKTNMGLNVSGLTDLWTVYAGPVVINGTMQQNGPILEARKRILARCYPRFRVGQLVSYHYDSDTSACSTSMNPPETDTMDSAEVYVPPESVGKASFFGNIASRGDEYRPDGSRHFVVDITGSGDYGVNIAPNPSSAPVTAEAALEHRPTTRTSRPSVCLPTTQPT